MLQAQDGPLSDAWIGNQLIDPQKGKLEVQTLNSQVGLCSCPPLVLPAPCSTLPANPQSALPRCRLVHPCPRCDALLQQAERMQQAPDVVKLCLQDHLAGMRWDPAAFKDTTTSYDNVKPAPQSKRIMNEAETLAKRNVVRGLLSGQPGEHNTMHMRPTSPPHS